MKAFISIKYHPAEENRTRVELVSTALSRLGIASRVIVRDVEQWGKLHFSPAALMQQTFDEIKACDFMLVELTEKGVGVGIEAGYAYGLGKAIYVAAEKGAEISATLQGIATAVYQYHTAEDLAAWLARQLADRTDRAA
jgi:hypothetical protein